MRRQAAIEVHDPSHVGDARRLALEMARDQHFDAAAAGRVAVIVNELSSNLVKHTRGGELLLSTTNGGAGALEMVSIDRGPGIGDVGRSLRDGHSTAGTPGTGLGAIRRMSDIFDINSSPTGTVVFARVLLRKEALPAAELIIAGVSVPKKGEEACGDAWAFSRAPARTRVLVADGLGHGPDAATASGEAVRVFAEKNGEALPELFRLMHTALRPTRGAAVGVAEIDAASEIVRYAGVGNISASIVGSGTDRKLVSHDGTLGFAMPRVHEYTYPFPRSATLVLHSDGIRSQWTLEHPAGLALRHPGLIAGVIYRDFARGGDDATVVVCSRGDA